MGNSKSSITMGSSAESIIWGIESMAVVNGSQGVDLAELHEREMLPRKLCDSFVSFDLAHRFCQICQAIRIS